MLRLSKSKILCWINCSHRFKRLYIDDFKPDKINEAMQKGLNIHKIFEESTKDSKCWIDIEKKVKESNFYKENEKECNNFLEWQKTRKIPLYQECKFFDSDTEFSGIIDRVDVNDKGEIIIVDYKTGKGKDKIDDYRFELSLYAYLFEKNHNQRVSKWAIFFPSRDLYLEEPVDRQVMINAVKTVKNVRKEICAAIEKDDFPKNFNGLCHYCELFLSSECEGIDGWLFK